ncbi:TlpA family protein disulfide reductase [Modestobacter lacusdianchii]
MSRAARSLVAVLALGAALLAGCSSDEPDDVAAPSSASSELPDVETDLTPCPEQPDVPAADSDLPPTVFECFGGGTLDLSRAPGVPAVLNLWASWCGPCREELPLVQQLADVAGDQVRVLGVVSVDGVPQAASFAEDSGVTFPSAFDADGEVMSSLGVNNLPHTVFLAADGSVAHLQIGPVHSLEEFEQLVADHLDVQL